MDELNIITMNEVETEDVSWLWKPYIPFGKITLIQGDGGEGKTTTALAIAAAVTTGKALPGGVVSNPAPVILQNAEDSYPKKLKPTLAKCGADLDLVERIDEDECAGYVCICSVNSFNAFANAGRVISTTPLSSAGKSK